MGTKSAVWLRNDRKLHARGATLMEVMIAAAIGLIVILGISTTMVRQNLNVKAIEQKNELRELKELITAVGSTEAQCLAIFAGSGVDLTADTFNINGATTTADATLTRITIPNKGNQILQPGDADLQYLMPGLRITSLWLERPGTSLGGGNYQGWLRIEAEREEGRKVNKAIAVRLLSRVPINLIDSNSNGMANSCLIGASNNEQIKTELVVAPTGPADCIGDTGSHIQDCVNLAAASNPARRVLIKAGTYTNCANIIVPAHVRVRGEGQATVLHLAPNGQNVFAINNSSDVQITDLQINIGTSSSVFVDGIAITDSSDILIDHISFRSEAVSTNQIRGINTNINTGNARNHKYTNNTFGTLAAPNFYGQHLIRIIGEHTLDGLAISNNRIEHMVGQPGNPGVIRITPELKNAIISNNVLNTNTRRVLDLSLYGNPTNLHIDNNSISVSGDFPGNANAAIYISSPNVANHIYSGLKITNNHIQASSAITGGIRTTTTAIQDTGAVITGNKIDCFANAATLEAYGIELNNSRQVAISENEISNCRTALSIEVSSGEYNNSPRVVSNTIKNSILGITTNTQGGVFSHNILDNVRTGITVTGAFHSGLSVMYNRFILSSLTTSDQSCFGTTASGIGVCVNSGNWNIVGNQFSRPK